MKIIALLFDDVIEDSDWQSSGFTAPGADLYKLEKSLFRAHLRAIRASNPNAVLTFDDGGASAHDISGLLESHGFRGLFFIATDWISRPGFLTASQIQDLAKRGHPKNV